MTNGGTTADGDNAIGLGVACRLQASLGNDLWDVNDGLRMQTCRTRAQDIGHSLAQPLTAAGSSHHESAADLQPLGFFCDAQQPAGGKDDALWRDVVGEGGFRLH